MSLPGAIQVKVGAGQLDHVREVKNLVQPRAVVGLVLDQARADVRIEADDASARLPPHQLGEGVRGRQAGSATASRNAARSPRRDRRHVLEPPVPRRRLVVVEGVARLLAVRDRQRRAWSAGRAATRSPWRRRSPRASMRSARRRNPSKDRRRSQPARRAGRASAPRCPVSRRPPAGRRACRRAPPSG